MLLIDKEGKTSKLNISGPAAIWKLHDKSYTLVANHAYEGDIDSKDDLSSEGRKFFVNDFELTDEQLEDKKFTQDVTNMINAIGQFEVNTNEGSACLGYMPDILIYKIGKDQVRVVVETPMLKTGEGAVTSKSADYAQQIGRIFIASDQLNWQPLSICTDSIHEKIAFKPFAKKDIACIKISTAKEKKAMRKQLIDFREEQHYEHDQQQPLEQTKDFQKVETDPLPKEDPNAEIVRGNDLSIDEIWNLIEEKDKKNHRVRFSRLRRGTGKNYQPVGKYMAKRNLEMAEYLIFGTNHDLEKTDKMFRMTGQVTDKWINDANYRTQILAKADAAMKGGHAGPYELRHLTPSTYPKSMDELFSNLDQERLKWHLAHDERDEEDGHVIKRKKMTHDDVIQILLAKEKWAIPYSELSELDDPKLPVMYYDWDKGIFRQDLSTVMKMIAHVDHDVNGDKKRNEIFEDMKAQSYISPRRLTKYTNPELIAVGNGVFDRKSKKLLPYGPDDFCFTQQIVTNYSPSATVEPTFGPHNWSLYKWLHDDVAKGDEDMFYTLKQVIFAAVTGDIRASKFAMLYDDGEGSTGKSTFMEFIENLVGKTNCKPVDFASKDITNILYAVYGAQVLIFDDPAVGGNKKIGNTGTLKKLVSNQDVGLHQKFHDNFSAKMNAFLLMAINGLPHFEEMDAAIAKRMLPIKFTRAFDRNNPADQKVEDEYIGDFRLREFVLNDVLNNVSLDNGYKMQKDTDEIMKESFAEYDPFISFYEDVMSHWEVPCVPGQLAFNTYKNYAMAGNFGRGAIGTLKQFYKRAEKAGWIKKRTTVPSFYPYPDMFLSSENDESPLKTDYTIADYEFAFYNFGADIDRYVISAARMSNGVDLYTGGSKKDKNDNSNKNAEVSLKNYGQPNYLASVPSTTLLFNPKVTAIVNKYVDDRKKQEKRFKEIEKHFMRIDDKIVPEATKGIPDLTHFKTDNLHMDLVNMEKHIKDNPNSMECHNLTSHYDEIIRNYKKKQAEKEQKNKNEEQENTSKQKDEGNE